MKLSDRPEMQKFLLEAPCTRCKGSRSVSYDIGTKTRTHECGACAGRGTFPGVDVVALVRMVLVSKPNAAGRRTFRRSWPSKLSPWRTNDPVVRRAYYVWRMARFHGGADVTMPFTANCVVHGDPHIDCVDLIASLVAQRVFGTDRAAMYRWGNLLGFVKDAPPAGLPESAYEGGPVVTSGEKPDFEALELE